MFTVKKEVEVTLSVENLVEAIETMVEEKELCGAERAELLAALCPSRDEIIDLLRLEHEARAWVVRTGRTSRRNG